MPTTARDRSTVERAADAARRWSRRGAAVGSLAIIEPDLPPPAEVLGRLLAVGVHVDLHEDPLAALVRLGARRPVLVAVSAATAAADGARLVPVLRAELGVPVLVSFAPHETPLIGPAVAAGGLPGMSRPYRFTDVLDAIEPHWPRAPERVRHLAIGDLRLDVDGYDAHLGERAVDLTAVEFDALAALARRPDHVVLRDTLAAELWPRSSDPDGALVATIARVRRKLACAGAVDAIRTVRGLGYRLEAAGLIVATPSPRTASRARTGC